MRLFRVFANKSIGVAAVLGMLLTALVTPPASAAVPLVPSAPWDPKITSISNTSVTLAWQDPLVNAGEVASYTVQQTTDDLAWTIAATGIATSPTGTYSRVLPVSLGVTYRFRVIAHTATAGDSPASVAVDASTQYTAISGGTSHTCAVTAAGTVYCWGSNAQGQLGTGNLIDSAAPVLVPGLSTATAVATGAAHTCALLADATIKCWGDNIVGQLGDTTTTDRLVPTTVSGVTGATSVSAGAQHTCATITGGTLRCWGLNTSGQLGDGSLVSSSTAVTVAGITTATQVTTGAAHSCARLSTGAVRCWGQGTLGQLGNGLGSNSATAVAAGLSTDTAVSVRSGDYHTCAVLANGTVECWGSNGAGQLGNGTITPSDIPVGVTGIANALSVAAGANHTCLRLSSNEIACFGQNTSGQIGDNSFVNRLSAVVIAGLDPTAAITAGANHTCVVLVAGPAFCWGSGSSGQLGDGGKSNRFAPVAVESSTAVAVSEGNSHSCAVTSDGNVKCWGLNTSGQLGDGTTSPTTRTNPTAALGIASAVSVSAGGTHTCAVLADGTVWCWGNNVSGQLGDGTTIGKTSPVQVLNIINAVSVSAATNHTCALLADGTISCWGSNAVGQLGNGSNLDSSTPVAVNAITSAIQVYAGYQSTCAVMSDTLTYCWGLNNVGQLGDGTTVNKSAPQIITGLSAAYVQVGRNNGCAVLASGAVRCWGANTVGQIGDGTTTTRLTPTQVTGITTGAIAVTVGDTFACALMLVGTAQCWGGNTNGELGNATNSNSSIPVAVSGLTGGLSIDAGVNHTCVAVSLGSVKCWGLNTSTQLGDATNTARNTPVKVNNIDSVLIAPSTVPDAPTGVTATRGDGSAIINWTASPANGSPIVGYTVSSSPASAGCSTTSAVTCTVTGLTNGTSYTFTVTATNGRGTSPASVASNAVTPAAIPTTPTNVTAVRGDTKATVSWTASSGNGQPITGYTVTSTPGSFTCTTGGATSCDVTGLTNGTAYTFIVKATNAVGDSFNSAASASVTPAGVPLAVSGIVMTRTAAGATVTWAAAGANGTAVTGYSVTINGGTPCSATAANRTCTFVGLNATAAYAVAITATNAVGTNTARVVAAPSFAQVTRGDGQATVVWNAPAGGDLTTTSFTVQAVNAVTTAVAATCTNVVGVDTPNVCIVTGLTNGTSYVFRVIANDSAGNQAAAADTSAATPAGLPTAPTAATAVRGDTSATVSWSASSANGAAITGYTVTSSPGGLTCTTLGTLSCVVSGLTNGTSYTFTVTGTNAVGNSSASTASNAVTPAKAPDAPTGVSAARSDASALVSWTAPAANGEAITGYTVTSNPGAFTCTTVTTSCTVNGLTNGTSYTFTVTATNAAGTSTASGASSAVTPAGVPTAPTTVIGTRGDQQVTLSWQASSANGSPVSAYTVTSNPGGFTCATIVGVTPNPLTCVVSGLSNGTSYTFTVKATNTIGDSLASSASSAFTPAKAPEAPTSPTATRGDLSALVSWTASVNNGEAVTAYTVTSTPGSFTCTSASTSCTVNGLTNGVSYTFTITATNAVGTSAASVATAAVVPAGVPTMTTPVNVTRGDTQATVSWTAAGANGSTVTGYTVTSTPGNFTCTTTITTTCIVTGLTNGTSYTFSVVATNIVGNSTPVASNSTVIGVVPVAPASVTATRANQSAVVNWTAADGKGTSISGYTVTSSPGAFTCTTAGTTNCTVTGLTNGTAYTFTVVATNIIGASSTSSASNSVTPAGAPLMNGAVGATRGDTKATISWSAATANGDTVTGYTVTSTPGNFTCTTTTALTCDVTGLTNGTTYTFAVTATNGVGTSSPITSSSLTVGIVPTATTSVTAVRGDGQAAVTWLAANSNGPAITGYRVTSTPGNFTCTTTTALTCNVLGLTNGTSYTFTVVATNIIGDSLPSNASNAVIAAGLPTLSGVVSVVRGDTQAVVSWPAGGANGDAITGYTVTASGGGGQNCTTNGALTCTVTGLTNGTSYTFSVVATNTVGNSTSITSSSVIVGVAAYATTFVSAVRGDQSAVVSWTAADGRGLTVTGYTVTSSPGGLTCTTGGTLTCTVNGLTNSTTYTFTVTATNSIGTSPASVASNTVTPAGVPIMTGTPTVTRGDTQATVTWSAANANGDTITGYTVTSNPGAQTCTTAGALTCTVTGLTNGTSYTFSVTSTNGVGTSSSSTSGSIVVGIPPLPPTSVSATRGDQSATVSWTLGDGRGFPILGYTATASPGGFTCNTTGGSSCVISGLANGTPYTFTVTSTTLVTTSIDSPASAPVIPAGAPLAPTAITVVRGNQQVSVSWAASNSNGEAIDSYTVTSTPGGFQCSTLVTNVNPTSCVVPGLTNGVSYTFSVYAHNAIGNGAVGVSGIAIPATNPAAPTGVSAVRGDLSATVSWTAAADNGDPVSSYVVTSTPGSFTCTAVTTSCVVTGLSNGVSYTFTVTAANAVGSSVASSASNAIVPAGVPTAPSGVTATRANQSATLTWLASIDSNGATLTGYTVTASPGGATCSTVIGVTVNPLSCTITGLTNAVSYTFSVVAQNIAGSSVASTPSNAVIPAGLPLAPTTVTGIRGDTSVQVFWNSNPLFTADGNGADITSYTVTSSGSQTCTALAPATSCVVLGLTNGTAYTFTVTSTNAIGNSVASAPSIAYTPAAGPIAPTSVTAVRGDQRATVSWSGALGNGAPITGYTVTSNPGAFQCQTVGSTTCVVLGLTNGIEYTFNVIATNAVSNSLPSAPSNAVIPAGAPLQPYNVTTSRGDRSITVSWFAGDDNGSPITDYAVTSNPGGFVCPTTTTSCTFINLSNGVQYTFVVVARNAVGTSTPTAPTAPTSPAAAPAAPTNVSGQSGASSVTVSWSAAVDNGLAVVEYRVTALPGGNTCTTAGTTSCQITGLTNGQPYTFRVIARNALGDSLPSTDSAPVTPMAVPDAPTGVSGVLSNSSVSVSWSAANPQGSPVIGYQVTAQPGGATCSTAATSCVVLGLTNGTAYTFTVKATNSVGTSAASDPSGAVTPATLPGAPQNVTATRSNQSAVVSWSAALNNGAVITQYRVIASAGTSSCVTATTSCTVTGLTNGQPYTFTVIATNIVGNSAPSSASNAISPAGPAAAPTNVTAVAGAGMAMVSWLAPLVDNGAPVTGYRVVSNPAGLTCQTGAVDVTSCTVTGLTNGTPYTFVVYAINDGGDSPASSSSTAVIPTGKPTAVTKMVAVSSAIRTATVTWSGARLNGGRLTRYEYSYKLSTASTWRAWASAGSKTKAVVSNLAKGKTYQFKFRVITSAGQVVSKPFTYVQAK